MQTLIIDYSKKNPASVQWGLYSHTGTVISPPQRGKLADIPKPDKNVCVSVIISGLDVITTQVKLPQQIKPKQILQFISYNLEEYLTAAISELHFAYVYDKFSSSAEVAVIAKQHLQNYLQEFAGVGIYPDIILPAHSCLPLTVSAITIAIDADNVLVRTENGGFTAPKTQASQLLPQFKQQNSKSKKIQIYCNDINCEFLAKVQSWWEDINVTQVSNLLDIEMMRLYKPSGFNLLQAFKRSTMQKPHNLVKAAAIMFGLLLVVLCGGETAKLIYYKHQARSLQADISKIYYNVFPQAQQVMAPRARFERKLKQAHQAAATGFVNYIVSLDAILKQQPDITLKALEYQQGSVKLNLEAQSSAALQNLETKLQQNSFNVKQLSRAQQRNNAIEYVLDIRHES